jgi:hypothetical protein
LTLRENQTQDRFWRTQRGNRNRRLFMPILDYAVRDVWLANLIVDRPRALRAQGVAELYAGASGECPAVRDAHSKSTALFRHIGNRALGVGVTRNAHGPPPFAHGLPTSRPGAAGWLVLPGWGAAHRLALVAAQNFYTRRPHCARGHTNHARSPSDPRTVLLLGRISRQSGPQV